MKNELNEKQFFIIEKNKYYHKTTYRLYDETMYDLTNAVRKILALDTLNEDRERISHYLQEVKFSEVQEPLILTKEMEVKEDNQEELPF